MIFNSRLVIILKKEFMKNNFYASLSSGGFHRVHYTEWGDAANPRMLICAHGLTRCGRDFDTMAESLSAQYRVICPDVAGRGESDWLTNKADYNYPQYLNDMSALIARTGASEIHWVGTSMGGIIGMLLAAQPTRGLDVGSIEFIHKQIIAMRDAGMAVLLISTELDEIFSLSDRIAVMYSGKVIDTVNIEDATRESVGLLMAGVKRDKTEKVATHG